MMYPIFTVTNVTAPTKGQRPVGISARGIAPGIGEGNRQGLKARSISAVGRHRTMRRAFSPFAFNSHNPGLRPGLVCLAPLALPAGGKARS